MTAFLLERSDDGKSEGRDSLCRLPSWQSWTWSYGFRVDRCLSHCFLVKKRKQMCRDKLIDCVPVAASDQLRACSESDRLNVLVGSELKLF